MREYMKDMKVSADRLVKTQLGELNKLIKGDRKVGKYENIPIKEVRKRQGDDVRLILERGNISNINTFTLAYANLISAQLILESID